MGTKNAPGKFDCYSKLEPDEPYFLIMGRDQMGQQLVSMWAQGAEMRLRGQIEEAKSKGATEADIATSENWTREYAKIEEALKCASEMGLHCRALGKLPMRWSAKAPVITRAPAKTTITREQVKGVLYQEFLPKSVCNMITELARAAGVPE